MSDGTTLMNSTRPQRERRLTGYSGSNMPIIDKKQTIIRGRDTEFIDNSNEKGITGLRNRMRIQKTTDPRWADKGRNLVQINEYLGHISEAIEWIESFLGKRIDNSENHEMSILQLEKTLQDGVILAEIAKRIKPSMKTSRIVTDTKHHFKYTENMNAFFDALKDVGLPATFWFETVDLYNGKNIPRVIFCIHALSHLLYATQIGPKLKNYNGEGFSDDILIATQRSLEKSGATIPDFCQLKSLKKGFQDDDDGLYTNDNRSNNSFEFSYIDGSDSFEDVTATLHRVDSQTPELDAYDDSESKDSSDEEGEDIGPSITVFTNGTFIVPNNDSNISSGSDYSNDSDSETDDAAQGFIEGHTTQFKNGQMSSYQQGTIAAGNASHTIQKLHEQHRLQSFQSMVQKMQARIRTASVRHQLGEKRREMYSRPEDWIIALQATSRRYLVNKRIRQHQLDMYNQHQERLRNQGHMTADYHDSAYQKLKSEKNPSVGTVKSVIHMLSNSDVDFNEDLVLEDLRQKVIASIRENNQLDHQVSMVDIKIALLLKNAVSLDEVIKLSNAFFNPNRKKQQQRRFSEMVSSNATTNPLDLRGVDKSTRQKVDLYQQLVYLLQTQPYYLAQLMSVTGGQVHGDKKGQKKLEDTVLALFGYGTNAREECLLINLCKACISQEMRQVKSPLEFLRGNYTFMKLVVQVNRGAKERAFFKNLFGDLITKVIKNESLDLETNPMVIYQKRISKEESKTGQPSAEPYYIDQEKALRSTEVAADLNRHIESLVNITEEFLCAIIKSTDEMPFGLRVIARELRMVMEESFPDEDPENINMILGNFISYRYLSPAITSPEQYDIIHGDIYPMQRKNLAEISKLLQQISSGKLFDARSGQICSINSYLKEAHARFTRWFMKLTDVEEPEEHFGLDQLSDHTNTQKPIVYVHPTELYQIHQILEENIDYIESQKTGVVHTILRELGNAPVSTNTPLHLLRLELSDRSDAITKGSSCHKKLLLDTKRLIILVIQVQSGSSLEAILNEPSTDEHERIWEVVREEQFPSGGSEKDIEMALRERNFKFGCENAAMDVKKLSFKRLKSIASKLHGHLVKQGEIPQSPGYQSIISMIALDITKKGERRRQRNIEIKKLQTILNNLEDKKTYLIGQGQSYRTYLEGCMKYMAEKKGKKKFVFPFTKQYFHMRSLQRNDLVPKHGSFKYTAKTLHDRGIIMDLTDVPKKLYANITIILSMDAADIITVEGYFPLMPIPELRVDLTYGELLQKQYEGQSTMKVLDGVATVNVNLLIYLINKKFYHTS